MRARSMSTGSPTTGRPRSSNLSSSSAEGFPELTALTMFASASSAGSGAFLGAGRPCWAAPPACSTLPHPAKAPITRRAAPTQKPRLRICIAFFKAPQPGGKNADVCMLDEIANMGFPVARLREPRKSTWKGGIPPAMRHPRRVVQHAQRAQRLDELQFTKVKIRKLQISLHELRPLSLLIIG